MNNIKSNTSETTGTSRIYQLERSNTTSKTCTSGTNCNDTVTRQTTWTGAIGLMYPSDFGYSSSPLSDKPISTWDTNTWILINKGVQWTITPGSNATTAYKQIMSNKITLIPISSGITNITRITGVYTRPVVYLKPNVKITGNGTKTSSYTMSLD